MADPTELLAALQPILEHLAGLDPADPGCRDALQASHPLDGAELEHVQSLVELGLEEGWLCPRQGEGLRFGRLAKAGPGTHGFSIDAVDMTGPGPGHVHPQGEFDLCFAIEGSPRFDGAAPGWTVYGPGTWHVPTVRGGRMAILYFRPGGELRFQDQPG